MPPTPWDSTGGNFLIGVDAQPIEFMDAWAGRGVNTLVRADLQGRFSLATWASAAGALGLKTIREPNNKALVDGGDKTLIAYALPDEADTSNHWYGVRPKPVPGIPPALPAEGSVYGWPAGVKVWASIIHPDGRIFDLVGRDYGPGQTLKTGATWQATAEAYGLMADAARKILPDMPIFGNFAGNYITQNDPRPQYEAFTKKLTWASEDWHVIDKDPTPFGQPRRYQYWWSGWAAARLVDYSGGKPALAYIECSHQNREAGRRWPTKAELWAEVFSAICQGASGIIYFPQRWGHKTKDGKTGFYADGVGKAAEDSFDPADAIAGGAMVEAITKINATIKRLNPYLTRGKRSVQMVAGGVFLASWALGDKTLFIRVNATPAAVTVAGIGPGGEPAKLDPCGIQIVEPIDDPPTGEVTRAELLAVSDLASRAETIAVDAHAGAVEAVARCLDAAAAMAAMARTLLAMAAALNGDTPAADARKAALPATPANESSGKG